MSIEILINVAPRETRVAVLENKVLQEIHIERATKTELVGSILKGKVLRVLPGMQAAFIDIGLERAAFLHIAEINYSIPELELENTVQKATDITEYVSEGQEIIVQVIKDPIGRKGARLTTQLSLSSRDLVFMPGIQHIGVSLKIKDAEERERLREILQTGESLREGGYIIRTAAESKQDLDEDKRFLHKIYDAILVRAKEAKCGATLHEDLPLVTRTFRDLLTPEVHAVTIDSPEVVTQANKFLQTFVPRFSGSITLHEGDRTLFEVHRLEEEIEKALQRSVQLKSGGYLVFDQTEAMCTIDVNTGAFVGSKSLEETILRTNLEAATMVARQIRLRNLGGIIIIDFIDMTNTAHEAQVLRTLERELGKDRIKSTISEVTSLGLVQMTRKRTRESLAQVMCDSCHVCQGKGMLKSIETVCYDIMREILHSAKIFESNSLLILAAQPIVDRLLDEESAALAEVSDQVQRIIKLQVETFYTQEQFDVVPV